MEVRLLQKSGARPTAIKRIMFVKSKIIHEKTISSSDVSLNKTPSKQYRIKAEDGKLLHDAKLKSSLQRPQNREDNTKKISENSLSEEKQFACEECEFTSKYEYKLKMHTLSHNGGQRLQSPARVIIKSERNDAILNEDAFCQKRVKLLSCSKCSYMCVDESKLKLHGVNHGRKKPVAFIVSKRNLKFVLGKPEISVKQNVTFSCKECDEKFDDETILIQHVTTHARKTLLSCRKCSYMCIDENKLKTHLNSHSVRATKKKSATNKPFSIETDSNYSTVTFTNESGEVFSAFKCKECNKIFNNKAIFKRHLLNHIGKKDIKCRFCSYGSTEKANLTRHIMCTHVGEDPYTCITCTETFSDANLAKEHARVHLKHPIISHSLSYSVEKKFCCNECNLKFKENIELERHMTSHNPAFLCNACGKTFSSKNALKLHKFIHAEVKSFLCNECGKIFLTEQSLKIHELQHADAKLFPCDRCGKAFKEGKYLNKHILTHTREKKFLCNVCSYMCTTRYTLKKHLRTHSGEKPFGCDICSFKTADKFTLKMHKLSHNADKPFSCNLCSYACITKSRLKIHLISHTGEKQFSCSVCGKMFTTNRSLTVHMRLHTRTHMRGKRYSCEVCSYSSSSNAGLLRHRRCHTGEKPYLCEICDFKCAVKYTLRTHILTHTGEKPFPCHLCSHMSTTASSLKRHLLTHSGEKAFACNVCSYRGSMRSSLNRHMRTHLGEKPYSKKKRWVKMVQPSENS